MWTVDFPTTEGWYLFYGWDFGKMLRDVPRLHTVRVVMGGNSLVYLCDGHFIYKSEAIGLWYELELPEMPNEEDLP